MVVEEEEEEGDKDPEVTVNVLPLKPCRSVLLVSSVMNTEMCTKELNELLQSHCSD